MSDPRNPGQSEPDLTYERSADETPSEAVITAVAAVTNQPPVEMDLLIGAIDPDALNTMLTTSGKKNSPVTLIFDYCECQVTVTPDEIQVDHQA